MCWRTPRYHSLLSLLQNPVYAGAYAYGRTRTQVHLADGRKQVSRMKKRAPEDWRVLITDHHEGYIDWTEYQRIQILIANNCVARGDAVRGALRSGQALLVGLLRCGHCGRKLHVEYPSQGHIRYACMTSRLDPDGICCVRINGLQADENISEEVLRIEPQFHRRRAVLREVGAEHGRVVRRDRAERARGHELRQGVLLERANGPGA